MDFDSPLESGRLLRRYKRFLADIVDATGQQLTIHCPNPGSMLGCAETGSRIWYSRSDSRRRKYPCTLEIVETLSGERVGVNPTRANAIVAEAMQSGRIEIGAGAVVHREVAIPGESGRFDFRLDAVNGDSWFVEVKSVTMVRKRRTGEFPDARSDRATRHVRALRRLSELGHRTMMLFCVQHSDAERVAIADDIDPDYGAAVRAAHRAGVQVKAYRTSITPQRLTLTDEVPVLL